MENVKIVNLFHFGEIGKSNANKSTDGGVEQRYISEMEKLASAYNFDDEPFTLHFFGDKKSGLQFRIECSDVTTKARITKVLKSYLLQSLGQN